MVLKEVDVLRNGAWNSINYEGNIEELQVLNISNNAKLPVYARGDSAFQNNMQSKNKPVRQTDNGIKFYELFNDGCEAVDLFFVTEKMAIDVLRNGAWNSINYEGNIEELQVLNISNNAKLPVYARGDSAFQNNMQSKNKPVRQTDNGIKFYELFNELYESIDFWTKKEVIVVLPKVFDEYGMRLYNKVKDGTKLAGKNSWTDPKRTQNNTRDSFYVEDNDELNKAMNFEWNCWLNIDFKDDDQISNKVCGGHHGGPDGDNKETRQGRCYALGINTDGTPHLAKEFPHHEKTPKCYKQIKIESGMPESIGDINKRDVIYKIIQQLGKLDGKSGIKFEFYIDPKCIGEDAPKIIDKPSEDFKLWWTAVDVGEWKDDDGKSAGEPYLENQGIANGGPAQGCYLRIDNVGAKTKAKMTMFEIVPGEKPPDGSHQCDPGEHWDEQLQRCVKIVISDGGTIPKEFQGKATLIYNSNLDLTEDLVGKTLEDEKIFGTQQVLFPSHAGDDDTGVENHNVVKIDNLVWKELQGDKVRDYLDVYRKDNASPNLLLVHDAILDKNVEDLSHKFGNHSLDGFEFGGYGISTHPAESACDSKCEYNHDDSVGGSNNGEKESEKFNKQFKTDVPHKVAVAIQTVEGKREKIIREWIIYPNEDTWTPAMTNRRWQDADFTSNKKFVGNKNDTDEIKNGLYLSPLMRIWIRINGVSKKAKGFWRNAQIYKIPGFTSSNESLVISRSRRKNKKMRISRKVKVDCV